MTSAPPTAPIVGWLRRVASPMIALALGSLRLRGAGGAGLRKPYLKPFMHN